jgi:hypothetical protein
MNSFDPISLKKTVTAAAFEAPNWCMLCVYKPFLLTMNIQLIITSEPEVQYRKSLPEAEFLDESKTKVLRVFLLTIHSHLYSFA